MSGHKIRKIAEISMSKAPVKTPTESWPRSQLRPDCGQQKMNLNLQRTNVLSNIGQKMNLTLQRIIKNNVLSNIGQKINLNAQRITRGIHTVSCKWKQCYITQCKKKKKIACATWFLNHILLAFLFSTNSTTVSMLKKKFSRMTFCIVPIDQTQEDLNCML